MRRTRESVVLQIAGIAIATALLGCNQARAERTDVTEPPRAATGADAGTFARPADALLRSRLSKLQYAVTQQGATEPPFNNAYWNQKAAGVYVDVVTGEPLFSSLDKFDSGTGWPSFTRPIEDGHVTERQDTSHGMVRTEVRSRGGGSHLGHIFNDGPLPTRIRYCVNSASLRFVPVERLEAEGLARFLPAFATAKSASTPPQSPEPNVCTAPASGEKPGCAPTFEVALLAGGCFWGMEEILREIPGVIDTDVGYTGGDPKATTYGRVKAGNTGQAESVRVTFDPTQLSYADLLEKWFFRMHDPTTINRQGNDVGTQYRSAIFVNSAAQRRTAEAIKAKVGKSGLWKQPIVTEIVEAGPFAPAEAFHQDYLQKNPNGYTCHHLR